MAQKNAHIALAMVLGLASVTACSNNNNPPAQTPADQTMTTGATTPEQSNQPSQPTQPTPSDQGGTGMPNSGNAPENPNASTPGATIPNNPSATGVTTSAGETPSGAGTVALNDAQIVAVVQAADNGQIEQAHEAIRKAKDPRVKHFAQRLLTDHSAAETKVSSVETKAQLTPQSNAIAEHLKANGEQVLSSLKSASSGSDFDKVYIDAQVKQETKELELLDNRLISHAQNAELVKALHDVRAKVAAHLPDALEIQGSLESK
jgi:putative membrane protein